MNHSTLRTKSGALSDFKDVFQKVSADGACSNCPPLASLQSLCPSCHHGSQYQPGCRTPEVPLATLSPSPQPPLEKKDVEPLIEL